MFVFNKLLRLYRWLFNRTRHLRTQLDVNDTILDLGCGANSPIQYCNTGYSIGVDLFPPYLKESMKRVIHDEYICSDIMEVEFQPRFVDIVIALEILEHLEKDDGYTLIKRMDLWAKKKIIISTPNGFISQEGYDDNEAQRHLSGWSVSDLKLLGFDVYGLNGWKKLKGYRGRPKNKPHFFWTIISDLTQWITCHYPDQAFTLFAVKEVKKHV